jgi:hypothetical protein
MIEGFLMLNAYATSAEIEDLIKQLMPFGRDGWRVWSTRRSEGHEHLQLVTIPWLLGMPLEVLPPHPALPDAQIELLVAELNRRSGWDAHIRALTEKTLATKIAALPQASVEYTGRA